MPIGGETCWWTVTVPQGDASYPEECGVPPRGLQDGDCRRHATGGDMRPPPSRVCPQSRNTAEGGILPQSSATADPQEPSVSATPGSSRGTILSPSGTPPRPLCSSSKPNRVAPQPPYDAAHRRLHPGVRHPPPAAPYPLPPFQRHRQD